MLAPSLVAEMEEEDLAVVGVSACDTCGETPCQNAGVCQEDNTSRGYRCLCKSGHSGRQCEKAGDTCYPGACNGGICKDAPSGKDGFTCLCPFGRGGKTCDEDKPVETPYFDGEQAYMAFKRPGTS